MILAAGRGERMGELTATRPKPLLEVAGRALIEHHLARLAAVGFDDVVINLSYGGEQIRDRLEDGSRFDVRIRYSEEGEPPLETAGGIVHALPLLGRGPFLLVNADVVCDFDFAALRAVTAATLVLVPNPAHHTSGDFALEPDGRVSLSGPRLTFAGISVLHTDMFDSLPQGRRALKPVLDTEIAAGRLFGLRHDGLWLDVGTPERLEAARRALESQP